MLPGRGRSEASGAMVTVSGVPELPAFQDPRPDAAFQVVAATTVWPFALIDAGSAAEYDVDTGKPPETRG